MTINRFSMINFHNIDIEPIDILKNVDKSTKKIYKSIEQEVKEYMK